MTLVLLSGWSDVTQMCPHVPVRPAHTAEMVVLQAALLRSKRENCAGHCVLTWRVRVWISENNRSSQTFIRGLVEWLYTHSTAPQVMCWYSALVVSMTTKKQTHYSQESRQQTFVYSSAVWVHNYTLIKMSPLYWKVWKNSSQWKGVKWSKEKLSTL